MKLMMFTGVGATGKTTVAQRLKEELGAIIVESPVRKTFEEAGLATEVSMLDLHLDKQLDLQAKIYENYIKLVYSTIEEAYRNNPNSIIIAERSPADYLAYQAYIFNHCLTLADIDRKQARTSHAFINIRRQIDTSLVYFPFPAPFSKDTESSDGYRSDSSGKNYLWSCVLDNMLTFVPSHIHSLNLTDVNSIEERVQVLTYYLIGER